MFLPLDLPTVVTVSAAVMLLVSVMMSLFWRSQQVYQGFSWWVSAQWLATLGVVLQMGTAALPVLQPLSAVLMLQWPMLVLVGLRRFHPRAALPGSFAVDALLLSACVLGWLVAWVAPVRPATIVVALSLGMGVMHLYAAWVLNHLPEETRPVPVRALQVLLVLAALVQVVPIAMATWLDFQPLPAMAGVVLPLMLDALATLILCMVLTHDRTAQSLKASQSKLRMLANMDGLTSMPNRRHFRELADRIISRGEATPAVMLFDIDHFKQVNDRHGHAIGDDVLRLVARTARTTFRTRDIVGRLGGDEFVAVMPATSMEDALRVADRMVRHVERTRRADHPQVPRVGLSFGVVRMEGSERFEDALKRADDALYEAKRQGRCRAVTSETAFGQSIFAESRPLGLDGI